MIRKYFMTYAALLILLSLTVAEYEWHLTPFALGVSIAIAAVKAVLIAAIFMDLKKETPLIRYTAYAGLCWIFIFYGLSGLDLFFRG